MPTLNIKDPEVYELASELAKRSKRSLTEVVRDSLRISLELERARNANHARVLERVMGIARRVSSRPVLDPRSPDEILGYDDHGLPG